MIAELKQDSDILCMVFTPPRDQIPDDWLSCYGSKIHDQFLPIMERYNSGTITAAELCGAYILLYLMQWKKKFWRNGIFKKPMLASASTLTLSELGIVEYATLNDKQQVMTIFSTCHLRGVTKTAQQALVEWHNGNYPIDLHFNVPSALDLLKLQAEGRRVVSLFVGRDQMCQKQLFRDPMTFVLHDLEHASEFFFDQGLFKDQRKFYASIYEKYLRGYYNEALCDEYFRAEFEYVIADMNSHPEHLNATLNFLWCDFIKRNKSADKRKSERL